MKFKDYVWTGFFSGLIAPAVAFSIYTKINLPDSSLITVLHHIVELHILSVIISLSAFVNLLVFFSFIWMKSDKSARGVLAATFLYAFVVLAMKLMS